jgi:hypothetical protein
MKAQSVQNHEVQVQPRRAHLPSLFRAPQQNKQLHAPMALHLNVSYSKHQSILVKLMPAMKRGPDLDSSYQSYPLDFNLIREKLWYSFPFIVPQSPKTLRCPLISPHQPAI